MDNASVALLMLDIAAAKSTLKELQQAYTTASEEHQRTKSQLYDLEQELDVNPLYMVHGAKGSTAAAGRATAHQLQALHTENLQLKSLLKQEIEARQQLEAKHSALLKVLRNCGLLETQRGDHIDASTAGEYNHCYEQLLQHAAIAKQTAAAAATKQSTTLQERMAGTDFTLPAVKSLRAFPAASSFSAEQAVQGNSTSTIAEIAAAVEASFPASPRAPAGKSCSKSSLQHGVQVQQPIETTPATQCTADDTSLSSAYFPHICKQPGQTSSAHAVTVVAAMQHGTHDLQGASKHASVAGTRHGVGSNQQNGGNCFTQHQLNVPVQQQRQQQQVPIVRDWEHFAPYDTPVTCVATQGSSYSSSASLSSASSHSHGSHASELLDSEELEELAYLCDGLIGQQAGSRRPDVLAAAAAAVAAAASATGGPGSSPGGGVSMQRSKSAPHTSSKVATAQQQPEQQQQARPELTLAGAQQQSTQHSMPQTLPGMEVLTSQLQQLQQQVAMDPGLVRHHSSTCGRSQQGNPTTSWGLAPTAAGEAVGEATGHAAMGSSDVAAAVGTTQQQQHLDGAAHFGLNVAQQNSMQGGISSSVASGRSTAHHSSSNVSRVGSSLGSTMPYQGPTESADVMADLQQQLAQRMLEVKQRLSNICNGMLEEALGVESIHAAAQEQTTAATAASQGTTSAPAAHACFEHTAPIAMLYEGSKAGSLRDQWQQQQQQKNASQPACATGVAVTAAWVPAVGVAGTGPPSTSSWGTSSSNDSSSAPLPLKQNWQHQQQQEHGSCYSTKDAFNPRPAHAVQTDAHTRSVAAVVGSVVEQQQEVRTRVRVGQQLQAPQDTSTATSSRTNSQLAAELPAAAATGEQHAPGVVAGQCGYYAEAEADYHDAVEGTCSDSSWSTCEVEDEEQHQQPCWHQYPQQKQHQQQQGHGEHNKQQQYRQAHAIDTPQGTPERVRGHAGNSSGISSDGVSPCTSPSTQQHADSRRMCQQQQHQLQTRSCVSDSLEGVLFGIGGRVAAEVLQTFSPLKGAPPSGQAFWSPGSPLTPLKPRNA